MAGNRFLLALPRQVHRTVAPKLQPVSLRPGMLLAPVGAPTEHLYLLDSGLISMLKVMNDGRTVEVGVVGIEGVVGIAAVLGMQEAAFEAVVQLDGVGHRLDIAPLQDAMAGSIAVKELVLRYMHFELNCLAQTAACNILHSLRERCCRWLLVAADCTETTRFAITHEFLALMMGVHRPALSLTLEGLHREGILANRRGSIAIADRAALERAACECYGSIRSGLSRVYAMPLAESE
jgi:CRP-like cAMP-binding protein